MIMLMGHADVLSLLFAGGVWCATYMLVAVLGIFQIFNFLRTSVFS